MLDVGLGNYDSSLITQAIWLHTDDYFHTTMHFCFYSQKTLDILGELTKLQLCLVLNLKIEILFFFVNGKWINYIRMPYYVEKVKI